MPWLARIRLADVRCNGDDVHPLAGQALLIEETNLITDGVLAREEAVGEVAANDDRRFPGEPVGGFEIAALDEVHSE